MMAAQVGVAHLKSITRHKAMDFISRALLMAGGESGPPPGQMEYITPGTYSFVIPAGVTSVCVVAVGSGGGGGNYSNGGGGGGGGGLGWKNNIQVTPGDSATIIVSDVTAANASGGNSSFDYGGPKVIGYGGFSGYGTGIGGSYLGDGGGNGGPGGASGGVAGGGGGAGGYSGIGGTGGASGYQGGSGSGGGGGGGGGSTYDTDGATYDLNTGGGGGGGVSIYGQGSNGSAGASAMIAYGGGGGSGGSTGNQTGGRTGAGGGDYGGGGGGGGVLASTRFFFGIGGQGRQGAVRVIWGAGRAFPSTNTGNL